MNSPGRKSAVRVISVPGKTFLLGEYAVLEAAPAILLTTAPRFELEVKASDSGGHHPFAENSPAEKYIQQHRSHFSDLNLSFNDPHQGQGGLGASSAQYALVWALKNGIEPDEISDLTWSEILHEYQEMAMLRGARKPSGADFVSQVLGGVTYFDPNRGGARRLKWQFADLEFSLCRTGKKEPTHTHLSQSFQVPVARLRALVQQALSAFERADSFALIQAVREGARELEAAGLTAPRTRELLARLASNADCLAAKGCGALGADVLLLLHTGASRTRIHDWLKNQGLAICGHSNDVGQGLSQHRRTP